MGSCDQATDVNFTGRIWTSELGPRAHWRGELAIGTRESDAEASFYPIPTHRGSAWGNDAKELSYLELTLAWHA